MRRSALWTVLTCVSLVACGGGGGADPFVPPRDDGGGEDAGAGSGGSGATDGGGTAGSDGAVDGSVDGATLIDGPTVTVASPANAEDLTTDPVHTGDSVAVSCQVLANPQSPDPVDEGSVIVRLRTADDPSSVLAEVPALPTGGSMYSATLIGLNTFPTSAYVVECEARDTAASPRMGRAAVQILHDGGPTVIILSPQALAVVAQSAVLAIEVTAASAELGTNDDGATVASVSLVVAGISIPLVESPSQPGTYNGSVSFTGGLFNPVPSGSILVTVTVTNERGITRVVSRELIVDGTGPAMIVQGTAHDDGDLVRGTQNVDVRITDLLAGVDMTSLSALVVDDELPMMPSGVPDTYRVTFDTLADDTSVTELPLVLRAYDRAGNGTMVARRLRLDNQPPLVSLDSPPIREFRIRSVMGNTVYECSTAFDPLGSDSVNDGSIVVEGAEFRARVEDQTNGVEGNNIVRVFATVASDRVSFHALTDLSRPLVIDTDGDGICDEINDEASLQTLPMAPVPPRGAAYYGPGTATDGAQPGWPLWCTEATSPTTTMLACLPASASSALVRVIKAPLSGMLPAIWGMPPVDALRCVGDYWDWRQAIPGGGPVCVAVRAEDTLGNVGVSQPMRVCLQRETGGYDCLSDTTFAAHDCTSGTYDGASVTCELPPTFAPGFQPFD